MANKNEFNQWLTDQKGYIDFLTGGQITFDGKDGHRTPQVLVEDAAKKGLWVFPLIEGGSTLGMSSAARQLLDQGSVVARRGDPDFPDGVLVVYPGQDNAPHSAYVDVSAVRFVPGVEINV